MSTISKLLFGQVTNRIHGRKICKISFNDRTELIVKVNSDFYHELQIGNYFFVIYNPATKHISKIAGSTQSSSSQLDIAIENLDNCSSDLIKSMDLLENKDRDEALSASGVVLTVLLTVLDAVREGRGGWGGGPVNAAIGLGLTAGAALLTKMQYEALTLQQKAAIEALKIFERKLAVYHSTVRRYTPVDMRENVILDAPQFTAIATKLKRIFKNVTVDDFSTANINWSVA